MRRNASSSSHKPIAAKKSSVTGVTNQQASVNGQLIRRNLPADSVLILTQVDGFSQPDERPGNFTKEGAETPTGRLALARATTLFD
jgi:hypothetical protein